MLPSISASSPNSASSPLRPASAQRSVTVPARLSNTTRRASTSAVGAGDTVETLFTHAAVNIVSFSTQGSTPDGGTITSPKSPSPSSGEKGTLAWSSPTERLVAAGPLEIYQVPGSVSFLRSGKLLHAVLPKAQCWCVDGESKFALRVPPPNSYYRIELPYQTERDKEEVEYLKAVLDKILRYEKVPCPFKRGFEVELPEIPDTPLRRSTFQTDSKVKRWRLNKVWEPENKHTKTTNNEGSSSASWASENEPRPTAEEMLPLETDQLRLPRTRSNTTSTTIAEPPISAQVFPAGRERSSSVAFIRQRFLSEPSVQKLESHSHPSVPLSKSSGSEGDAASISSSADSFYSLDATSRRSSSPSFVDADSVNDELPLAPDEIEFPYRGRHKRQESELTVRASHDNRFRPLDIPTAPYRDGKIHSPPSTPPPLSDSEDALEPPHLDVPTPPDTLRLRNLTGASQRRAFSPMPHPANMFFRSPSGPRTGTATMIVQKAMEIFMGPPANLVALMLHIAARISLRLRGLASHSGRGDEILPGTWESGGEEEDEWGEDDYGIPLRQISSRSHSIERPLSEFSDDFNLGAID